MQTTATRSIAHSDISRWTELEAFFRLIGVPFICYDTESPPAELQVSSSGEEYASFPSLVPGTRWVRQPGHCAIAGNAPFIWCNKKIITVSATPGKYDVTEVEVENAQRIEVVVRNAALEVQDPPRDTLHYFCPKYYPAHFLGWRRWF